MIKKPFVPQSRDFDIVYDIFEKGPDGNITPDPLPKSQSLKFKT